MTSTEREELAEYPLLHDLVSDAYQRGYRDGREDGPNVFDGAAMAEGCAQFHADSNDRQEAILTALRTPSNTREDALEEARGATCVAAWVEYEPADNPRLTEALRLRHAFFCGFEAAWNARLNPTNPTAGQSGEDWHLIAETPPPVACHVLAGRFDRDCGEWAFAYVSTPPIQPFTHWRMVEPPKGEQP